MKTFCCFCVPALFLLHLSSFSDAPPSSSLSLSRARNTKPHHLSTLSHLSRSLQLLVRPLHLRQNLRHGHPQLLKHFQRHLERLSFSRCCRRAFCFCFFFFFTLLRFQTHQNRRSQNFLRLRRGQGHVDSPAAIDERVVVRRRRGGGHFYSSRRGESVRSSLRYHAEKFLFFPVKNWKKNGARKASQSTKDRTRIINARKRRENERPLVEQNRERRRRRERAREVVYFLLKRSPARYDK